MSCRALSIFTASTTMPLSVILPAVISLGFESFRLIRVSVEGAVSRDWGDSCELAEAPPVFWAFAATTQSAAKSVRMLFIALHSFDSYYTVEHCHPPVKQPTMVGLLPMQHCLPKADNRANI